MRALVLYWQILVSSFDYFAVTQWCLFLQQTQLWSWSLQETEIPEILVMEKLSPDVSKAALTPILRGVVCWAHVIQFSFQSSCWFPQN